MRIFNKPIYQFIFGAALAIGTPVFFATEKLKSPYRETIDRLEDASERLTILKNRKDKGESLENLIGLVEKDIENIRKSPEFRKDWARRYVCMRASLIAAFIGGVNMLLAYKRDIKEKR